MNYISVTKDNIENEHICCAISNNNDVQVASKKNWMKENFDNGLVFIKSELRGKCFIEYLPAENAWNPILANDYMYIDCLWVAGSLKGHGYSNDLLQQCISDSKAKGKKGLCILASSKKKPFLADPKYLKYRGFKVCDESDNGIQLWYLPFSEQQTTPKIKDCAKTATINEKGYVLYYTNQCPFNGKYIPIIEDLAKKQNVSMKIVHLKTKEEARNCPSVITTYALFLDGKYLTNEQMNESRFLKLINK